MHRMHPITKTLGLELLQGIIDSFLATDPRTLCDLEQSYNANESIRSLVQEVKTLQRVLETTEEDEERRALEEDIVGRILLVCWREISSAVLQATAKIVHYVLDLDVKAQWRLMCLRRIAIAFQAMNSDTADDNQACLRQILANAKAKTSKHKMYLAVRTSRRCRTGSWCEETLDNTSAQQRQ
ncbi:hypothetical protein BKA82DRAFT_1005485 [Pisolithus tinctorius]|uniref:Uncharacterized protein n=1 Tax=Pisolithus tinctorius Marx 270 TaxID=870435 RepID=A0A0C3NB79_PISTI|nr:hypothetical protein BKA82DRAFT_1005485 [Pisolithus tinctorius]KIN98344.1 hypothetical protein M404DRAFT_1005485 [Pisolithus tinctorius Marx 270]